MAASGVALDLVVTSGNRPGRTTQTGRGPLALVCDLLSCGGWKTGYLLTATLLPDPWVWHPRTQPRRKQSLLLETFVGISQTGEPEGHPVLECWEGASCASPYEGSLESQTQTEKIRDL